MGKNCMGKCMGKNSVCNGCHDLTMLCLNMINIAIITDKGVDYHRIIHYISKSEEIRFLENSVLENGSYTSNVNQY